MKFRLYHIVLLLATASCDFPFLGAFEDPGPKPELDLPALANAGADREVLRGFVARLEGGGTHSPIQRPLSVRWQQVAGDPVHLSNQASLTPTFLAPLEQQDLTFRLTVDDGHWTTSDVVTIKVRRQPDDVAPRIYAGPDRYVEENASDPGIDDIASILGSGVTALWERVVVGVSPGLPADQEAGELDAAVYRLTAIRDGLSSTPDYLLLHPSDPDRAGEKAPTAALVAAEEIVAPGEVLTLDAANSADANGDRLRLRWEQTHGAPQVLGYPSNRILTVAAPSLPQELVFRVFASDGTLESAPAQVSIVVSSEVLAPVVAPQEDARTHPGNLFLLDADGIPTPSEDPSVTFFWEQTLGDTVELELDTTGRFASFVAPEDPGDLAFAVIAELPDELAPVQSYPEVARVTVVELDDNLAPEIFLCHTSATVEGEQRVIFTGLVGDPEADTLEEPEWSLLADPDHAVELNVRSADEIIDTALCGLRRQGAYPEWSSLTNVYQADFLPPNLPALVTVQLNVCDALAACEVAEVKLQLQ